MLVQTHHIFQHGRERERKKRNMQAGRQRDGDSGREHLAGYEYTDGFGNE